MINVLKLFVYFLSCTFLPYSKGTKCGEACHRTDPDKINIHLVPHTHDDVGWLKTVDQYYYGSNKGHAPFGVQYILDSVVSELQKNTIRRFVYVESAYFWRWWEELDENDKEMVKNLINEGRLEFLHGGWCMSDEATPHYTAMIDQMTLGLKFLNSTFGECGRPSVSWQIDPFGHSSEVAIEFAEMGFDALFLGRIDHEDHKARKNDKNMEVVWRPDPTLGEAGDLFVSVLYNLYTAPAGFCFDTYCSDEPIMDNKKFHGYNIDEKIKKFEDQMEQYGAAYKAKNILVTMGSDFTYSVAASWFKNIDKLIKYTNSRSKTLNLLYSTPSCYVKAVNSLNLTWSTKEDDDFFPYGSDEHSYWTGYFTSRPTLKYMVYKANNILQATKQLATVIGNKFEDEEFEFKRALAIAQHHDGVSGTEKQHVADDYAVYLEEGINAGKKIFIETYKTLYGVDYPDDQHFGNLRNISQFNITEDNQNFVITLYNPLSRIISTPIKFPVQQSFHYKIYHCNGTTVEYDLIPISANVLKLPGRHSNATHDIIFIAKDLPPLGITNYYIQVTTENLSNAALTAVSNNNSIITLSNGNITLEFNKTDGLLQSVTKNGKTWPFYQNFYIYNAAKGYNYNADTRASGAYIFRPIEIDPKPVSLTANITQYHGINVFEVHQTFSEWLSQIVRIYKDSVDIEFEWLIDSIPITDWTGIELVTRYTTDVNSNSTFYTDSNGRRWMKRIRNKRKYWNLTITEPVASNYYPLTTSICLRDNTKQVTVITDRPEGGTSMHDGELELMLHRRLLYDDDKGVVEPLDETAFGKGLSVRGTHIVQINELTTSDVEHRLKAVESAYHPVPVFAKTLFHLNEWITNYNRTFSLLLKELPPNIHILTLERWQKNQLLLRLEHIFQANENRDYAHPVDINIKEIFKFFGIYKIQELTLAANLEKEKLKRLKWNFERQNNTSISSKLINGTITLLPMQIKTFLLFIEEKDAQN